MTRASDADFTAPLRIYIQDALSVYTRPFSVYIYTRRPRYISTRRPSYIYRTPSIYICMTPFVYLHDALRISTRRPPYIYKTPSVYYKTPFVYLQDALYIYQQDVLSLIYTTPLRIYLRDALRISTNRPLRIHNDLSVYLHDALGISHDARPVRGGRRHSGGAQEEEVKGRVARPSGVSGVGRCPKPTRDCFIVSVCYIGQDAFVWR